MNENLSTDTENEIKLRALIDNTAQGIFNYLKEIENKREIYEKRWIWELLQNALDVATTERKIEVQIIKDANKLTFKHNGRPFKPEEVAHLIYHGSTKRGQEIGKFGTGFLVAHLLSKQVTVKGIREDEKGFKKFEFKLDRSGPSPDDIKNRMEETWKEYQNSLRSLDIMSRTEYTAQFEYPLTEISLNSVKIGINTLIEIAPYVLAFNDKLGVIKISDETHELKFELVRETKESDWMIKKEVKEEKVGDSPILYELCIVKENDVEIAIKVRREGDNSCEIENLGGIPKIFIGFPIYGTDDLPFPVVVNSRKFEPTERREGVFLGKEKTPVIKQNKELFEKATGLFIKLISVPCRWKNVHALLGFQNPPHKDWLDQDWYTQLLKELIDKIKDIKVVKTESGYISYNDAYFPTIDSLEKEKLERLWELCHWFSAYKDKIPIKDIASEWEKIIGGWKSLGVDLSKRQLTIEKLATEIESTGSLQNFKNKLTTDADELEILNEFYKLLIEAEKVALLDQKNILPEQNGNFKKKPNLFRDEGINETLKNISSKLGMDVRSQLLHLDIFTSVQNLLSPKTQDEVLNQVVNKVKQPSESGQYLQTNIDLFDWLLENDKFEYFDGYPILSCKEKTFTKLSKKERVIAPTHVWNEKARMYAEIFPQDMIISSVYFEKISEKDKWNKLKDFILTDPVYYGDEKINGDDLALLSDEPLEEDKEHETITPVELSKIAFLEVKDKGIIDTVRKSKDKARRFLGFLFDYVIEKDSHWTPLWKLAVDADHSIKYMHPRGWACLKIVHGFLCEGIKVRCLMNKI
ncbi:MAG: ATP-binding protein [bacterium JZ-2024 1]